MVIVDDRYCKGCGICIHFCAKHVLAVSDEVNGLGYHIPYVSNENECTNCRQCELFCPDFAVFVVEDQECGDG